MKIHELGHAVLYVANIEKSTSFYRDILGFPVISTISGSMCIARSRSFLDKKNHIGNCS